MIAVTGVLGFIGSSVLHSLVSNGPPDGGILAIDHPFQEEKRANRISSVPFLDHTAFLRALLDRELSPNVIIHLGACSSTTETDWDYLRENNLEFSQRLWTWCSENNSRYIYASSAATYGDGSQGFDDGADISLLRPLNLYGKSKHDFDLWVENQARKGVKGPPQCVGLKFFNVFGPGEAHKGRMASMVFHAFHQINSTGRIRLFKSHRPDFEDGGQLRDFIYIDQVVNLILQCLRNPSISGLFNVGTGRARSFRELAEAAFAAMKRAPQIDYIPMPEDIRDKYQYFTEATMAKAAHSGLHLPEVSLEEAVADYIARLRNQAVMTPADLSH